MKKLTLSLPALLLACAPVLAQSANPSAVQHTAITIAPQSFDPFAGFYQMGPHLAVRLWREDDHYFFGTVGTPQRQEIFPESPTQFFLKTAPVTLTFAPDASGNISGLTINQAGRLIQAVRIDEMMAQSLAAAPKGHPMPRTWRVMNTVPTMLTTPPDGVLDYWPCFSPDGKAVLFSRTMDKGKSWTLLRMAASGGAVQNLATPNGSASRASWSADGNRIAFNLDGVDGGHAIWVMDNDSGAARALGTEGAVLPTYPSWYPDGKAIAFDDAGRNILYRVNLSGGASLPLTNQSQVLAGMGSVSPDGNWIAFAGQKNSGQIYNQEENQIWLVDEAGASRLLESAPLPGRTPSWSPDGKRIAFESDRGSPDGHYAAFVINRDGTGLAQVTDYALNASHPVFSPDGRKLVMAVGDPAIGKSAIAIADLP